MSVNRSSGSSSSPLPADVTKFIKSKARQLADRFRFPVDDCDDLEQEITLEVLQRRATADAKWHEHGGFLNLLVRHAISRLIEHRTASIRDYRREVCSLDRWMLDEDEQWVRMVDTITAIGDVDRTTDLGIELRAAVASLPKRLAVICGLLMNGHSVQEIARITNRHRSCIYDAIRAIHRHFVDVGIEEYLFSGGQPDSFGTTPVINGGRTSKRLPKGRKR